MPRLALSTFAISGLATFMVVLDNLVVTSALPAIREDLGASLADLEWTVNAYTLTFAVLLLTGAALGDRFGRRRMFLAGLVVFTGASALSALAPTIETLVAARALQGVGGAIVTPLALTILADAVGPERRAVALGAWSGIAGLAVACGPIVGGAVVEGISWQWIFWLNVPIGLVTIPLARRLLRESHGPLSRLDLRGLALASGGMFGIVWGLVHGNADGWSNTGIVASLAAGVGLTVAFVAWQLRAPSPMLPLGYFRNRAFAAANGASFLMYFGLFGSVFLMTQFLQSAQGLSPLEAGIRTLPWTAVPMVVAPLAGLALERIGGGRIMATGLALQAASLAWFAAFAAPDTPYTQLVPAFVLGGLGSGLFWGPVEYVVLGAVRRLDEGKASGVNNALRELGGVFGIAVLAAVFASRGDLDTPDGFVSGLTPALWVGVGFVGLAAVSALAVDGRRRARRAAAGPVGQAAALPSRAR